MASLTLAFASKEDSLSVRKFSVREGISMLFEVSILARSPVEELDLDTIVGNPASFRVASGLAFALPSTRVWGGLCSHMVQLQAESTGLSTYHLRIVPTLWRTTLRRNNRIFQHATVPEIVLAILEEWGIRPALRLTAGRYPKHEYRVQYGETDFAFISRLLEEAGISYCFEDQDVGDEPTRLVLSDSPERSESRAGLPLPYVDNPNESAQREFVTKVALGQDVRPGRFTIRDFDFRLRPDYRLIGESTAGNPEEVYEQYHYMPGAFQVETNRRSETPAADDKGVVRSDTHEAQARAARSLQSDRRGRRLVTFESNAHDLAPGVVFSMSGHARRDLGPDRRLLVVESVFEGMHDQEWSMALKAVFADVPHRPERVTPRPKIVGVQSAVVVGPPGEEIHTDEFGRVRVQFHWDREGRYDDSSSCWIRVSQGWAGTRFGMITLPRVGQEVLVDFFEGDPDRPVIVGRVYNNTTKVPYKLPDDRTKSGWKSDSSPGSNGYNELSFEDAKGRELVYVQAERNLEKVVKQDEAISVGRDRKTRIGELNETIVGTQHHVEMEQAAGANDMGPTYFDMIDRRIRFSTGEASIELEGPNITLQAKGVIKIHSSNNDVLILGGPWVKINCGPTEEEEEPPVVSHHVTGILRDQDGAPVRNIKVVVKGSDGGIQQVDTDETGRYFALIPEGACEVSLPGTWRYGPAGTKLDKMTTEPEKLDGCGLVGQSGAGRDIVVHARMQACCRKTLQELDDRRKALKGKSSISLVKKIGEKTIELARTEMTESDWIGGHKLKSRSKDVELMRVTREMCKKICELHAAEHTQKGDGEEATFWLELSAKA